MERTLQGKVSQLCVYLFVTNEIIDCRRWRTLLWSSRCPSLFTPLSSERGDQFNNEQESTTAIALIVRVSPQAHMN